MKKKRSISSRRWLHEHFTDRFVRYAQLNNLRSRAWFKLRDIDLKYSLLKDRMHIIDLGAFPGSWSQYALHKIGKYGYILACDLNLMPDIPGVCFIQGDISIKETRIHILQLLKKKVDLVMSDISPNLTGISTIDIPRSIFLANLAFKVAYMTLSQKGIFLVKIFQGLGVKHFFNKLQLYFNIVKVCKPVASRNRSREIFILAIGFKK